MGLTNKRIGLSMTIGRSPITDGNPNSDLINLKPNFPHLCTDNLPLL